MRKAPDSLTGIKTGYGSRSKWKTIDNRPSNQSKKKVDYNNDKKSYPNGVIPFIFIALVYIIALILALTIKPLQNEGGSGYVVKNWYNIIWYVSGIPMCLIVFWTIGRSGFMSAMRFGMMKLGRQIRYATLKRKIRYKTIHFAVDDVNTIEDWEQYLKHRKVFTKKMFLVSIGVFCSIFAIVTIIMFVFNGVYANK